MRKDNTPNYNTKNSNITDFKNFVPSEEKKELKKLKRTMLKNPDDVYNLPNKRVMKFNKVTKTMQSISKDEIDDSIKDIEMNESASNAFLDNMRVDMHEYLVRIKHLIDNTTDDSSLNQLLQIKMDIENIMHNIDNK